MAAATPSRATITVIGLGPAGPDLLTAGALEAIAVHEHRFVRTRRHPAAEALGPAVDFDAVYDELATFAEVYAEIAARLVASAQELGRLLYAVPGSPLVLERTVELLLADGRVEVTVVPGLSFVDLSWTRLGLDPYEAGVRLVDGHRFAARAAGERGPLLVAHCHSRAVLSDIKLAVDDFPAEPVTVLQRLGSPDEAIFPVDWADLDRSFEPDHLTAIYVPHLAAPVAAELQAFVNLVTTLRERCPWDSAQTHESLRRHLLEETYELIDAIDGVDPDDDGSYVHLEEELGDVLFQVVLHAVIATESGQFGLADVARTVHDKLYERHPHVFGDAAPDPDIDELLVTWEAAKKAEKDRESIMDGMPATLPALLYAAKVLKKAASARADDAPLAEVEGDLAGRIDRLGPETGEAAIGEILFLAVDYCRRLGHDPELALRSTAARFEQRFRTEEASRA